MGRAKLRMELITKEKTRNTSYQNRKHGIIKKAKELSVLCDVNTAIILYPPDSNQPEIWPENPDQIKNMIGSYKETKNKNGKRTFDLADYFQTRKRKIEDELVRAREKNMEAKYSTWFDELNGLSEGQLRQFAMGLENKEKTVRAHLKRKKRNFNHYVGSYPSLDQVQVLNHELIRHDLGWFGDALNVQTMSFGFGVENNQWVNYNVGSFASFDQGQAIDYDMMSHVNLEWFDYAQSVQMASGFDLEYDPLANHLVGSYPSLDQVQVSQDLGWFDDAPTSLSIPLKPEMGGLGSPVFEGGVVYGNSNPWASQPVEQCGLMPEELAHVNYDGGVGDFNL